MKKNLNKLNRGFTIIEVLIVLAIAGLILAIVFFAVPQLQRNQRDNQRQSTTVRLKAEFETFAANNQGTYPFAGVAASWVQCNGIGAQAQAPQNCRDFYERYISSKVKITDPTSGSDAIIRYSQNTALPGSLTAGDIYVSIGAKCAGDSLTLGAGSPTSKQYAVLTVLDRAGTAYCVDNG